MSLEMRTTENGLIIIEGDEQLLAKIEGESLDGVDVSDVRLTADNLADLYQVAEVRKELPYHIKRYAVLKQKYLDKFSK